MKYLVTGGAGFIGSHIVEALLKKNCAVRVLDNFSTGKKENLKQFGSKVELIEGDVRGLEICERATRGIDYVLHEAALGSVPRSVEDPLTTNDVNITGTLNMLEAAKKSRVKRFIYASSSSVYGNSPTLPKVESMNVAPLSPYALSKLTGEIYTELFFKLYGLETIALRYFNVFGPRQDPHSQYAAVIPLFISSVVEGRAPTIFGDGEQTRDFNFVEDVVTANLKACEAPQDSCGEAYNIAGERQITINKLFEAIRGFVAERRADAKNIQPVYVPPRAGDIRDSLASCALAAQRLDYHPCVALHEGLKRTVKSFLG